MSLADRVSAWLGLAALLRTAGVRQLVLAAVLVLVSAVLPIMFIIAMSQVISALWSTPGTPNGVAVGLIVAVLAMTAQQLFEPLWTVITTRVARTIDRNAHHGLITNTLVAPLAVVERSDVSAKLSDAVRIQRQGLPSAGDGAAALLLLTAKYLQLTAAVTVIGVTVSWLVAVALLAAAVLLRIGQRGALSRYFGRVWHGLADERKRMYYLHNLGTDSVPAKEIRALQLTGWLKRRTNAETGSYLAKTWKSRRTIYLAPFLRHSAIGFGVGVFVFVAVALHHRQDTDAFGLVIATQVALVPLRFCRNFSECDVATEFGQLAHSVITDHEREVRAAGAHSTPRAPGEPVSIGPDPTITFEQVHFHYPGSDQELLRGVHLTIPAGKSTAIVGVNGAGKTTLVKLLAGFYEPTLGRITIGGHDLRDVDLGSWRRRTAAVTQNFARFELSLRENVLLGTVHHPEDPEALHDAIDLAKVGDLLKELPDGLDTVLSPRHPGGVGLSGGQWQRVALARALYAVRRGASLVVLDEPTAQLDARAEAAFHEKFFELTAGVTTVVISHRFSTVRRTDVIAVLEHGTIREYGSHDELIARSGIYAEMFRLQAARFDRLTG